MSLARGTALWLAVLWLAAGCGEDDRRADPAQNLSPEAKAAYTKVAIDLREIATLAKAKCAKEAATRRALVRLQRDARRLPAGATRATRVVDRTVAETRAMLASCP